MESAERLLSQLRCGNIVEEDSFSMSILDCPPLTIQWSISNNDAIKYIESRDAAIRADERAKAAERAVQWVNKNLADEHMPLLYKRLEEGELRLAITCGEAVPDPRDALIEQMGKALMELRECMTEIAGYELPKNWADEALAAYKEAQHG